MKKKTKIVAIGNSRGVRIPQLMLEMSGIVRDVELQVSEGEITITPIQVEPEEKLATMQLSENVLAQDWDRPEEDEAWREL